MFVTKREARSSGLFARTERIAIALVATFIALSAIAGGTALISGAIDLPLAWLSDTPFQDYTIPGVILGVAVGGSALVSLALVVTRHPLALHAALSAGLIQVGWIVGEVILMGAKDALMLSLQVVYFAAGATLAALAANLVRAHSPDRDRLHAG